MKRFDWEGSVPQEWLILAAATVAMACGFGMMTTVAGFIQPLELEFGWARGDISAAYTMTTIGAACGGLFWGFITDRLDTRPVTLFGAVVLGGGLLLLSQQSNLRAIQSIYFAMGALGFACLYTPVLTTVAAWFGERRGLATGDRDCRRYTGAGDYAACSTVPASSHGLASGFPCPGSWLSRCPCPADGFDHQAPSSGR